MKKLLFILLLIPILTSAQTAKEYVEQGNQIIKTNDGTRQQAIELYTKAIKTDPNYAEAYLQRANSLQMINTRNIMNENISIADYTAIIADYSSVIRLKPADTDAYYRRAFMKNMHKDYDGCIEDYKKLLVMNPKSIRALSTMTLILDNMPDHKKAVREYTLLISLGKNYYSNRGWAKYKMKDYKGAINDYMEALKITKDSARIFNNVAGVYMDEGNYKAAVESYNRVLNTIGKRILAYAPDNAVGFYSRKAKAEVLARDYKNAIADYDKVVALRPITQLYNKRGEARYKAGDKTGACGDGAVAYKIGSRNLISVDSLDSQMRQGFPNRITSYQMDILDAVGLRSTTLNIKKYCK